jgi:hypothetical protein
MMDKSALLLPAIVLFVATFAVHTAAAQTAAPAATTTLDFIATARDGGLPVLSADDISLKVGGRQQRVQSIQSISGTALTRYVVLIVDEATLYSFEPVVKSAVDQLLASLAPGDLVAFYGTRPGGTRTSLTPNRKRIADAVTTMKTGPGVLWSCQSDLIRLIGLVAGDLPKGRSSSIAVISRGHPEGPSPAGDSGSGPCTPKRDDLRQLEEAIAVAQVNLHLFTVDETQRAWSSWGFDNIAGNSGGTSGQLTWKSQDGLVRAIQTPSAYYRVTFAWDAPIDRAQRVELRAKDKNVKVRTSPWLRPK